MLLTIGMIVKNEEKHLRDCLTALKPLLEQVPSELIICDTGSTDSTVEIAKEFTSKVFEIGWRDDFGWAREQNLKRARGKWYMYIDGDEVFESVNDLIEFFNSGEYKKYACASFEMKNFLNPDLTMVSMFSAMRLYRIDKDTRWYGKIHENIRPVREPQKNLKSLALHYGYVYASEAEKEAKHQRNIVPMLEDFEKNPKDGRNVLLIIQQYKGVNDYGEVKKFIDIGLELYDKNSPDPFYHAILHQYMGYLFETKQWQKTIDAVEDYFARTPIIYANAPHLKQQQSFAYNALKRYEEAGDAVAEAWDYKERDERGELDRFLLSVTTVSELSKDVIISTAVTNYIVAGAFDAAYKWIEKYPADDPRRNTDIFNIFANGAIIEEPEKIVKLYDYAIDKYGINDPEYRNALSAIERNITTTKQKTAVSKALSEGREDMGDGYIRLQHLRAKDLENDPAAADELGFFLRANMSFSQHFGDLLVAAIKYKADFTVIAEKMHITNAPEFMVNTLRTTEGFADSLLSFLEETDFSETCKSIKTLRLVSGLLSILTEIEPTMAKGETVKGEKELILFESYARLRHKYLRLVYRDDVYCNEMAASLPEQDGFAFFVGQAFECKDANDKAGYARNLRMSLEILPNLKDIVSKLVDKLKEEEAAPTVHEQLAQESARLKSIIYTMINTGNMAQAAQILEGYKLANPTDPEIAKIEEMVAG